MKWFGRLMQSSYICVHYITLKTYKSKRRVLEFLNITEFPQGSIIQRVMFQCDSGIICPARAVVHTNT